MINIFKNINFFLREIGQGIIAQGIVNFQERNTGFDYMICYLSSLGLIIFELTFILDQEQNIQTYINQFQQINSKNKFICSNKQCSLWSSNKLHKYMHIT